MSFSLSKCIYAFSYLDVNDKFNLVFRRLADYLARSEWELKVFSPADTQADDQFGGSLDWYDGCEAQAIDYLLAYTHTWIVDVDLAFHSRPNVTIVNLANCFCFWRQKLSIDLPGMVLNWGSTAPVSRVLDVLCRQMGIPIVVIEKGFFSGTVMIEPLAHGALSILNLVPCKKFIDDITSNPIADRFLRSKYVSSSLLSLDLHEGKKTLLFLGDFPAGAGVLPSESPYAKVNCRLGSPKSLLTEIVNKKLNKKYNVIFQPHPADRSDYSVFGDKVNITQRNDPAHLLKICDVLLVGLSTVQFLAMAVGVPVVLFGNSQAKGKGVALEIADFGDLERALEEGTERYSKETLLRAKTFVSWCLNKFLFEYDQEPGARPFDEFAEQIKLVATMGAGNAVKIREIQWIDQKIQNSDPLVFLQGLVDADEALSVALGNRLVDRLKAAGHSRAKRIYVRFISWIVRRTV